jgi:RNase H-fold protein (predicted Holliday junction resolvase)
MTAKRKKNKKSPSSLRNRIIYLKKDDNVFVFSSHKEIAKNKKIDEKEFFKNIFEQAIESKCQTIFGIGWSIPCRKNSKNMFTIKKLMGKYQTIKYFVGEKVTINKNGKEKDDQQYFLYTRLNGRVKKLPVTVQRLAQSTETKNAKSFLTHLQKIEVKPKKNEIPILLLSCGENSIFSKGIKDRIESIPSYFSSFKTNFIIFNPSHRPYGGRFFEHIEKYHKYATSHISNLEKIITATNSSLNSKSKQNINLNEPQSWQGKKTVLLKRKAIPNYKHAWYFTFRI